MNLPATAIHRAGVGNAARYSRSVQPSAAAVEARQSGVARNHYKGAAYSPRRPIVPAFYRDARFDANQWSRYELARKIRDHARNIWLIGRLRSIYSQYSVGPNGLRVVPASSEPAFNEKMQRRYDEWCECPALDSALPMGEQHQLQADTTHIDGGYFIQFTYRRTGKGQSIPAIQLIEGHRVSSPGGLSDILGSGLERENVVDGVNIDSAGRPNGYWIRDSFNGDEYSFRPIYDPSRPGAGGVMHVYDPDRIGQYRELTPYHAVINQIQDLEVLRILEMDRAKENARRAYWLKTVNGELPDARELLSKKYDTTEPTGKSSDPDAELQKRLNLYSEATGSTVNALQMNEDVIFHDTNNPSAATQWYWMQLYEEICSNVNIPLLVVLPRSIQGTVGRGVYDDAHVWFTDRFFTFRRPAIASYRHFASWAVNNFRELADPPHDYLAAHVTPPRAINVDKGNNSASMLAEYAAGITNLDEIAGARGGTARDLITRKANNVGLIKQIAAEVAKKMGVPIDPAEISAPIADVLEKLGRAEQAFSTAENIEKQAENAQKEQEKEPVEA